MEHTALSPLQMKDHRFTNLRVKSIEFGSPAAEPSLKPTIWFEPVTGTSNQWRLVLTLVLTSADASKPYSYDAEIQIQGLVEAKESLSMERREQLALVNGFSILYSAAREMLLNVTSRSAYGAVGLPTISFVEIVKKELTKTAAEKPAAQAVSSEPARAPRPATA